MVGSLKLVGDGKWPRRRPESSARGQGPLPLWSRGAPHGLYLLKVAY